MNGIAYEKHEFTDWILKSVEEVIDLFIKKYNKYYDEWVTEPMAKVEGFKEYYLDGILKDTAGFTGTELHRRTVGMANVTDVTTIADEKKRLIAERINILAGKEFILKAKSFKSGMDYVDTILNCRALAEEL